MKESHLKFLCKEECIGCKALISKKYCMFVLSTYYEEYAKDCPCQDCLMKPVCDNRFRRIYNPSPCKRYKTYRKRNPLRLVHELCAFVQDSNI